MTPEPAAPAREVLTAADWAVLGQLEDLEQAQLNFALYETGATAEEIAARPDPPLTPAAVAESLARLARHFRVLSLPQGRYRSRIAEIARLLKHVKQRFGPADAGRAPFLVHSLRVHFQDRTRLLRRHDFAAALDALCDPHRPHLDQARRAVRDGFAAELGRPADQVRLTGVQRQALADIGSAYLGRRGRAFVVTGNTGSGKTEAALLPLLLGALHETLLGVAGCKVVLVYPRQALARNQLDRLARYLAAVNAEAARGGGRGLSLGIIYNQTPERDHELAAGSDYRDRWPRTGDGFVLPYFNEEDGRRVLAVGHAAAGGRAGVAAGRLPRHPVGHPRPAPRRPHPDDRDAAPLADESGAERLLRPPAGRPRSPLLRAAHRRLRRDPPVRHGPRGAGRVATAAAPPPLVQGHGRVRGVRVGLPADDRHERDHRQPGGLLAGAVRGRHRHPDRPNGGRRGPVRGPRLLSLRAAGDVLAGAAGGRRLHGDPGGGVRRTQHGPPRADRGRPAEVPVAGVPGLDRQGAEAVGRVPRRGVGPVPAAAPPRLARPRLGDQPRLPRRRVLARVDVADPCQVSARRRPGQPPAPLASSPLPVYSGTGRQAADIVQQDVIFATTSLEVGYDDPSIQFVLQHHAPRTPASFVQRRGRAGRSPVDRPITAVTLSRLAYKDAFYYQNPRLLYDPADYVPPLNVENYFVQRFQTLCLLFDELARLTGENHLTIPEGRTLEQHLDQIDHALRRAAVAAAVRDAYAAVTAASFRDVHPDWRDAWGWFRRRMARDDVAYSRGRTVLERCPALPRNLFGTINLPTVRVIYPVPEGNGWEQDELDVALAFTEVTPGKVSRRFGPPWRHLLHWREPLARVAGEATRRRNWVALEHYRPQESGGFGLFNPDALRPLSEVFGPDWADRLPLELLRPTCPTGSIACGSTGCTPSARSTPTPRRPRRTTGTGSACGSRTGACRSGTTATARSASNGRPLASCRRTRRVRRSPALLSFRAPMRPAAHRCRSCSPAWPTASSSTRTGAGRPARC